MNSGTTGAEILLVEDNPNDVELILHVFQWCNLGDRIHVAWNGEEALDYLLAWKYSGKLRMNPQLIQYPSSFSLPPVKSVTLSRAIHSE